MAIKEKGVIYPPSDLSLLYMEQDPKIIDLKKYVIFNIATGKPYEPIPINFQIMLWGVYLLEEIGINLGDFEYKLLPDLGIVSPTLSKNVKDFSSYVSLESIKKYLLGPANAQVKERIARIMYETKNHVYTEYTRVDYLGAVANAHYIMKNSEPGHDDRSVLLTLESQTQFRKSSSNEIALQAAKRFTYK